MKRTDSGFTLVELMVVVLILGILVAIAIPVFNAAKAQAQRNTCFANERTIEGAAGLWEGAHPGGQRSDLAGQVNATNPLVVDNFLNRPPTCPAATNPPVNGMYTLDAVGGVNGCTWGAPVHGHF
jgi:prepilin-type N-terminal cleavage/methylation domain-containing protein